MTRMIRPGPGGGSWAAGDAPPPGYSAEDRRRDFRLAFLDAPAGRRALAQLLARCRVWERSFVPGDTHETARREGMRDVGLWLLEIVNADPAAAPATADTEQDEETS